MNDQENYGGICYNSAGTSKTTCPAQPSYTPAPTCPSGQWWDSSTNSCKSTTTSGSCPSGAHIMYLNTGDYCMSDADLSKCGPLNSTSISGFGSCTSYQSSTASPYPSGSYTYTPAPSCPSGQWWDSSISACKTTSPSDTYSPSPTYTSTYTYTPYPTTTYTYTYTPYPSCPSGQWWDSVTSSCQGSTTTYTPYPTTTTYTPYPTTETHTCPSGQYWNGSSCVSSTSSLPNQHIVAHCQQLGRTWNGKICQANGLFARFYEGSGLANMLRLFYLVP